MIRNEVLICDFGSQYTLLLAKMIRKMGYYCEVVNPRDVTYDNVIASNIKMVVLSGGPQSVFDGDNFKDTEQQIGKIIDDPNVCVLGVCYGLQYMCHYLKGVVQKGEVGEYGKAILKVDSAHKLNPMVSWMFETRERRPKTDPCDELLKRKQQLRSMGVRTSQLRSATIAHPDGLTDSVGSSGDEGEQLGIDLNKQTSVMYSVFMSHMDQATLLPDGFECIGSTSDCVNALICDTNRKLYATQFHPEVKNTRHGKKYIKKLLSDVCGCEKNWLRNNKLGECENYIKSTVSDDAYVLLGLSGGVDSMVTAMLLRKYMTDKVKLYCVLIDHGLLRHKEVEQIQETCKQLDIPLTVVDASEQFLSKLDGVKDPEQKRKIVGACFIDAFQSAIDDIKNNIGADAKWLLAQGTLFSDVIESSTSGNGHTIKSHHNVGGLPEKFGMGLVEPLRSMFKNEVRDVGRLIGLPSEVVNRKPSPGPGLSIRILGKITREKILIVQKADHIFTTKIKEKGYHDKIDQYYAALLNSKSVGVVGDCRRYGYIVCLRAINSSDFMTATAFTFDKGFLDDVATQIVNSVEEVSRVVYDVTSKPPATIEME